MDSAAKKPLARRTPIVLALLTLVAVLAFALVSRLVTRYRANARQLAWHVFERGFASFQAGHPADALDDFRAALSYDPDNLEYQLNLARALRDTGKFDEARSYLAALWQRNPEDGVINLALGRLAVRVSSITDALRYYHNAIYGAWSSNPDQNRRQARLELIRFLADQKAFPIARAELMTLTEGLPPDPVLHLQAAGLFAEIHDYGGALTQYDQALQLDPHNHSALAGAGSAAYQTGHYRTAENYLRRSLELDPSNQQSRALLETAKLVLSADPFLRGISDAERNRRLVVAFEQAGERLRSCAQSAGIDLTGPSSDAHDLRSLQASWKNLRPHLRALHSAAETDMPDLIMGLVAQTESRTAQQCGPGSGLDLALSLIAANPTSVDQ